MMMPDAVQIFASVWFIGGQLLAAASDTMRMRIPNALTLALLGGYIAVLALAPPGWADLAASAAVAIATLAVGMFLFTRGWMGGGDVKLLAVSGLWLGPAATPAFLLFTAMAGGVVTLALLLCRGLGADRIAGGRIACLRDPMGRVPYGIAIAAAAIAVVLLRPVAVLPG